MTRIGTRRALFSATALAALALATPAATIAAASPLITPKAATATVEIYATGFNNPRGLKFGPDGALYVAEGGPNFRPRGLLKPVA